MATLLSTETPRINRYDQLSDELRQRILGGDLKPGDKLPSFTEMRQQYGVSQSTLDRAHSTLEAEGLIMRKRGAGTFVLNPTESHSLSNGKPQPTSFLSRAVAVFTPFAKPVEAHKSGGWLEWIGQGAVNALQSAGRHVVTLHPDISGEELQSLVRDRPSGVLVSAAFQEDSLPLDLVRRLTMANIPVVAYGASPEVLQCDCVLSDHEAGAYELTRFLIEKGRRRILNVAPMKHWPFWYHQRIAGYERAMREAGLEPLQTVTIPPEQPLSSSQRVSLQASLRPDLIDIDLSREDEEIFRHDVKTATGHLFQSLYGDEGADALMMVTDRNVFLAAAICRLLGKTPGQDVLITGYDNYFSDCEERALEPFTPSATVDKNNQLIGETMARLLFERIKGRLPAEHQTRCVAPVLITP